MDMAKSDMSCGRHEGSRGNNLKGFTSQICILCLHINVMCQKKKNLKESPFVCFWPGLYGCVPISLLVCSEILSP